ncbi:MAG: twin-arginine translocation signal domain-containing protein [Firmicutes bacterium]|nr:twin-arginine translocation signal domain-containing protein [Bacillota bacterium]
MNPCERCALSRRQFLRAAGGAIGAWMLLPLAETAFAAPRAAGLSTRTASPPTACSVRRARRTPTSSVRMPRTRKGLRCSH